MARKKTSTPVTNVDLAIKSITSKYGKIISTLTNYDDIETIPTGIIKLDYILGYGGLARGRIYELFGEPGSGKSTLAFSVIKQAQQRGLKSVIIDAENALDKQLLANMGIDLDDVIVVRGCTGEENLDAVEVLMKSGEIDVIVIDSVSALVPGREAESDIDKDSMGVHARLLSKACRKFSPLASKTNTLLIFINQFRFKIQKFPTGDPRETTGGQALKFFTTARIMVDGGKTKSTQVFNSDGIAIGHICTLTTKKNKLAPPLRTCKALLLYGRGFYDKWEISELAEELDIVEKSGSWYKYNGENIAQGQNNFIEVLESNDELFNEIKSKIISILRLPDGYTTNQ